MCGRIVINYLSGMLNSLNGKIDEDKKEMDLI